MRSQLGVSTMTPMIDPVRNMAKSRMATLTHFCPNATARLPLKMAARLIKKVRARGRLQLWDAT